MSLEPSMYGSHAASHLRSGRKAADSSFDATLSADLPGVHVVLLLSSGSSVLPCP